MNVTQIDWPDGWVDGDLLDSKIFVTADLEGGGVAKIGGALTDNGTNLFFLHAPRVQWFARYTVRDDGESSAMEHRRFGALDTSTRDGRVIRNGWSWVMDIAEDARTTTAAELGVDL